MNLSAVTTWQETVRDCSCGDEPRESFDSQGWRIRVVDLEHALGGVISAYEDVLTFGIESNGTAEAFGVRDAIDVVQFVGCITAGGGCRPQ